MCEVRSSVWEEQNPEKSGYAGQSKMASKTKHQDEDFADYSVGTQELGCAIII